MKVIIADKYGETKAEIIKHSQYEWTLHKKWAAGYSKVSLDGNSNMIVEFDHPMGKGRISIPSGACFDIVEAMKVFQACGRNLTEEITIYKEVTDEG